MITHKKETCHGCGNEYDDCICEELDAEANEGKYPDCDPLDGDYSHKNEMTHDNKA